MNRHIAVIGSGNVGATTSFSLLNAGLAETLSLIDVNEAKAEGEALDLRDGVSFLKPAKIRSGGYELCEGAHIVIITAGANQKPGQSRMELIAENANIYRRIIPSILEYNDKAIFIVVTNPVDPLTYLAQELAGLPEGRVFGSGTVLDTARLRSQINQHCQIDSRNIHGYVIGEHGDAGVPIWSATQISGMSLDEYCHFCGMGCNVQDKIGDMVKTSAQRIILRKGATFYAIALAVKRIVESILGNENSVLTVSTRIYDYYGIDGVCMSLPCILGSDGIKDILPLKLDDSEILALQECARKLKDAQDRISHLTESLVTV